MVNYPTEMYFNCIVAINKTTYLISQGQGNSNTPRNTYFFDFEKKTLILGPKFKIGRAACSCSKISNPITGTFNVIAVGGMTPIFQSNLESFILTGYLLDTTEILDLSTQVWRLGPVLPMAIACAQIVEHYQGGVVLIGGSNKNIEPQQSLYYLPS